jgi:putative two-component system response regulator
MARIFVVDDEPTIRSVIARIVAMDHHDVEEFADGTGVLDAVERDPPDLIVTDIFMPGMTGVELLVHLDRVAPEVPVIAISAGGDGSGPPILDEAIHLGAAATVGKPFRADEVRRTVERVLASSMASRAVERAEEDVPSPGAELEAEIRGADILIWDAGESGGSPFADMLGREGFARVRAVTTKAELEDAVARGDADLVVVGLGTPETGAFDVVERVRESASGPRRVPVLVLVGEQESDAKRRAFAAGASDCLAVPPTTEEALSRIRSLLSTGLLQRRLASRRQDLAVSVGQRVRDVELAHWEVVDRLATVAEYRDDLTGAHQRRVGEMAALIGRRLGMDDMLVRRLRMAAPLHDIGKVAIPDAILRKPAPLDHDEWKVMRTHTSVGARMLAGGDFPLLRTAERIALTHHERWDGVGYPEGLKGEQIPIEGRITAVADVIDCMTHPRPYRDALPATEAIAEVERCSGTQFDPDVASVVLDAWNEGELQRVLAIQEGDDATG